MSAIDTALSHAVRLHVDECEAVFSQKKIITIRITDSEIAEVKHNQEEKIGVRIINQKKISSVETTSFDEIAKLMESAIESKSKSRNFWKSLPGQLQKTNPIEKTYDKKLDEITDIQATDLSQEMINSTLNEKITSITGSLNIVSEKFEIKNSNGLDASDNSTYIAATINADSDIGNTPVSGIGQTSCRTLNAFSPELVGEDASNMCINSINPKKINEGGYSIIFEPYSVGEILSFVLAANFNLKTFFEKRSCFSEKNDSKIAVNDFNLIDDPHAPEGIGSKRFDDEGISTKSQSLIQNGMFKNIYSNSFDAFKEGKESSGNAVRPGSPMGRSAEPIPISSPHNLHIIGGNMSKDEIIKDTKHGLLVGRLWYTYAVNPIKGDFSCTARSGIRIIENGEIVSSGKSVRIVHNLPNLLQNISAIGNDEKNVLQWASLPSITPSLRADNIKVISI